MRQIHAPQHNVIAKNRAQQVQYAFVAGKPGIKRISCRPALPPIQGRGSRSLLLMGENPLTLFQREKGKRSTKTKRCKTFNKLQLPQSYYFARILASGDKGGIYRFGWPSATPNIGGLRRMTTLFWVFWGHKSIVNFLLKPWQGRATLP